MRNVIAALALFPCSAFAFPSVGDQVVFHVTVQQNGATQVGTLAHELESYDPASKRYSEVSTVILDGGAPDVARQLVKLSDLPTQQKISMLLAGCAGTGGTRQTIQVPGGSFDTCHINTTNGTDTAQYWFGAVPFGVVRFVTSRAGRVSVGELASSRAP
ncbi:MAG: hypothetical protein ACXWR1_06540 [Bdellovibrionota bacterium]